MLDHEGCGRERTPRQALEGELEAGLHPDWGDNARAIVIEPELDVWVWSDSPHVEAVLGWQGQEPNLGQWMVEKGFRASGSPKPSSPKEALEKALRLVRKPRSSAVYRQLAERVSFSRCEDPAFLKLRNTLKTWFRP